MLTAETVGKSSPEWDAQRERARLSRALMGGTSSMQAAGQRYLPRRQQEDGDEYKERVGRSVLLNKYKLTMNYLVGQVFQKPVKYQENADGKEQQYDSIFFERFQEDVDTQGTNISMFCKKVFREAMQDGVSFILSEYPAIRIAGDDYGRTLYQDDDGEWKPRTAEVDAEKGWRPYWVLITAAQVLDAWLDCGGGKSVLRAFRYVETLMREKENGEREEITRVRAIFPDHWEVWVSVNGKTFELDTQGANSLGFVPVDWFMPGEQTSETPGLTAIPALDDLAEMNRAHWQGYTDHKSLMVMSRAPAWLLKCLNLIKGEKILFGPQRYCATDSEAADIRSIGVDPASIDRSFEDLKAMEDYMGLYGLQLILPQNAGATATQAQIAASSSDSTLKGWVQLLVDCMENALKKIAEWQGRKDGPALLINSEFRRPYDASVIQQLASLVNNGQLPLIVLFQVLKKMDVLDEDMTFEQYTAGIDEDKKRNAEHMNMGFTPSFGSFPDDGARNTNRQQAPNQAQ